MSERAPIYVTNAGLVLFTPFMPRFFDRLDLLTTGLDGTPRIEGIAAASRIAHLLQFLVDQRTDSPRETLTLNRLIAGLDPATPVTPIAASVSDKLLCDELTQAMIAAWPGIGGTSPAGLRETFIQREGRLELHDDHWDLTVARKTVDVLVDQIPWSLSIIKHRWMPIPLHVTW